MLKASFLVFSLIFVSCNSINEKTKVIGTITSISNVTKPLSNDSLSYSNNEFINYHLVYDSYKDSLLFIFHKQDSMNLWKSTVEILDSNFVGEGSGWHYYLGNNISKFEHGQYGCEGKNVEYFYCINNSLVMHRDIETLYNAPLGYDQKLAYQEGDSTEYGDMEEFEELSIFKNNKIIYQLSADCGAPNSYDYVLSVEVKVLEDLKNIKQLALSK